MRRSASIAARGPARSPAPGLVAVLGAILLLAGATPFDQGSGVARALAVALPPLALGLAAGAICLPGRPAAVVAVAGGVLAGPIRGLLYDPVRDGACTRCLPSPYAAVPDQRLADLAALLGAVLVAAALLVAAVRRRDLFAGFGAGIAVAGAAAYDTPHGLRLGAVWAVVALAALRGFLALARLALAREAVARLTAGLRSGASPEETLRAQLRDPTAMVYFAAPDVAGRGRWITAGGELVPDGAAVGKRTTGQTTVVHSRGQPVARIHHTRPLVPITPELALCLEKADLEAGLAHQVAELAASRTRIVKRADAERRQLERDLHDGIQQYLLALAVELSLAEADAEAGSPASDTSARDALRRSRIDAEAALAELRSIAHGVYPVLLTSGGLAPALQALGREAGTMVTLDDRGAGGLSPTGAAALYALVEELATSGTLRVDVTVSTGPPHLVVVAGGSVAAESLNLERLAAAGGIVEVVPDRVLVRFP